MTISTRNTIKSFFATGDKPTQQNFTDLIDSTAFLISTTAQVFTGNISTQGNFAATGSTIVSGNAFVYGAANLRGGVNIVGAVSAATANFTGMVSAANINTGIVSATAVNAATVSAATGAITTLTTTTLTPTNIVGTVTNNDAATGAVGEFISVNQADAGPLATNVAANVTFIPLGPGDYDVWATAYFIPNSATTYTQSVAAISTVSNTLPTPGPNNAYANLPFSSTGFNMNLPTGTCRITVAASANAYLVALQTFTGSTSDVGGFVAARRRR